MIQIKGTVKKFGDFTALGGLWCDIPSGTVWGLVGINGSGKSTLLRTMTGIYMPDGGSVEYDGESVFDNPEIKGKISFVPDDLYLPPRACLNDMVKKYKLLKRSFNEKKFRELIAIFGLDARARFNTFSKGMRRQAATALAIAEENPYIFFDETFDGLDPFKRSFLKRVMKDEAHENGVTVIITSHSLRELEDICDSLAILDKGGFVLDSETESIKTPAVKLQVAFADDYDESRFAGLELVSYTRKGRVAEIIVRGVESEIIPTVEALSPILLEPLPLTLEEIFSYNLDGRKIVKEDSRNEEA